MSASITVNFTVSLKPRPQCPQNLADILHRLAGLRGQASLDQRQRPRPVADRARKEQKIAGADRLAERQRERLRRRQRDAIHSRLHRHNGDHRGEFAARFDPNRESKNSYHLMYLIYVTVFELPSADQLRRRSLDCLIETYPPPDLHFAFGSFDSAAPFVIPGAGRGRREGQGLSSRPPRLGGSPTKKARDEPTRLRPRRRDA